MQVAFTAQNRKTITGHAGMCRNFLVFQIKNGMISEPRLVEVAKEQSFHELADDTPHPLDGVDLILSGSMGSGLQQKLARRGLRALITSETDPSLAIRELLNGTLLLQNASAGHNHDHHDHEYADGQHPHPEGGKCGKCRCTH